MKQYARKQPSLSLVTAAPERQQSARTAALLNEFFDGWLTSVTFAPSLQRTAQAPIFGQPPLTSTDVTRVNRATVRESLEHRHWPPDVVQTFMRADVIKRKSGE